MDGYDDVLAALRAEFGLVSMVGGRWVNVISVALDDEGEDDTALLIGENSELLHLPSRAELKGWRILLRTSARDDFVIYRGSDDVAAMVAAAREFGVANGYLYP